MAISARWTKLQDAIEEAGRLSRSDPDGAWYASVLGEIRIRETIQAAMGAADAPYILTIDRHRDAPGYADLSLPAAEVDRQSIDCLASRILGWVSDLLP